MKICIASAFNVAVILIALTNCTFGNEENVQTMIAEVPITPRLPSHKDITAGDEPDHHSGGTQIKFEGDSKEPIQFEDDQKNDRLINIDDADPSSLLADITFDDEDNSQSETINNKKSRHKIKFAETAAEDNFNDDEENNDNHSQVVFEDEESDDDEDETEYEHQEIPENTIKFEGSSQSESDSLSSKRKVKERVKFQDDNNNSREPEKRKKKSRRPRVKNINDNKGRKDAPSAPNTLYPELGYSGIGYPNLVYPGYPTPAYPTPSYPYPSYPVSFPSPGYPGYPMYPAPPYPGTMNSGYVPYPGYQSDGRPPINPPAYSTVGPAMRPGQPGNYYGPEYGSPYTAPGAGVELGPPNKYPGTEYPAYEQGQPGLPPKYSGSHYPNRYHRPGPAHYTDVPSRYPGYQPEEQLGPGDHHGQPVKFQQPDFTGPSQPTSAGKPGRLPDYPGYYSRYPIPPGYPTPVQGYVPDPNMPYIPTGQYAQTPINGLQNVLQTIPNRSRRPKSLTQRAVSAVAEALTSIALYDDQQCVPRLLCEVAGGSATTSPTLLKATESLQPLITLLQAYSGVSSSPLFVFGRAAVLGVTSKGNPSTCRYAYPNCPNDPVELVNYLNNHNGGFFRFFGQPIVPQKPQDLEQFYNLLGQTNNLQQPQGFNQQQGYGYYNPYYGYPSNTNLYANMPNYGPNYYREHNSYRNAKNPEGIIEGRIQNKPGIIALEEENLNDKEAGTSKWQFPDETSDNTGDRHKYKNDNIRERPLRGGKSLKFPEANRDNNDIRESNTHTGYIRKDRGIFFPGQSNFQLDANYQTPVNPEEYIFDYNHNFYVKTPPKNSDDGVKTVYIVRGNGDPNNPEVVKVRPGQNV